MTMAALGDGAETQRCLGAPRGTMASQRTHVAGYLSLAHANTHASVKGTVAWLQSKSLRYTALHQQYHLVQPANTEEKLSIRPSEKMCITETYSSLASPLTMW